MRRLVVGAAASFDKMHATQHEGFVKGGKGMDMRPLKSVIVLMLVTMLVWMAAACGMAQKATPQEMPTVLGELNKLSGEDGNWLDLTTEQKLADFDYLYQTLEENYPYSHVLERMHGVSLEQAYQEVRQSVADTPSDAAFFVQVESFTRKAQMVGHLSTITPMDYDWYVSAYQNREGISEEAWPRMERLAQAYGNEASQASYAALAEIFWPVMERVQAFYNEAESKDSEDQAEAPIVEETYSNVETKILEQDKIAYIAINSFDMSFYHGDQQVLYDFYREVANYDHVIIDFTNNSGGGMSYFNDLVVAPNISESLSANVYLLAKDGNRNREIMDFSEYQPINQLPNLPKLNEEDLSDLDIFLSDHYMVEPLAEEKMLQGKLWILVGERVFSSSEYAAMFSKATGFATLVGNTTGGDGIGVDPIPIVLPNSGLIVRYSPIYGVTPDGASSQEYGTDPDIFSAEGESALETCLRVINEQDQEK